MFPDLSFTGRGVTVPNGSFKTVIGGSQNITIAAGNGVFGAYTQLTASLPEAISGFYLFFYFYNGGSGDISLATGPSGLEVDFVPLIQWGSSGYEGRALYGYWPIPLGIGTRISAKARATGAGYNCIVMLLPYYAPNQWGASNVDSYTASVGESGAGTSAWSQITAATGAASRYVGVSLGGNAGNYDGNADIGIGASGQEVVLIGNLPIEGRGNGPCPICPFVGPFPMVIPAGSRLSVRTTKIVNSPGTLRIGVHSLR